MIELDFNLINNAVSGEKVAVTGNAAIARGLMEASVRVITSYPGTPCAEVVENLAHLKDSYNFHIEWSINEKVAFEIAASSAMAGVRSAFITKHAGMNWAADPLLAMSYAGVNAGMLIISADDPGAENSEIEQDTRLYARMAEILGFEPTSPQEAMNMVINALEISERIKLPVFMRVTNRILYGRGSVIMGKLQNIEYHAEFKKEKLRWFIVGRNAVKQHQWLHDQQEHLKNIAEESQFNDIEWAEQKKYGIITSGVSYCYAKEAIQDLPIKDRISILKIGCFNPLPKNYIKQFLGQIDEVLIIEELEPFIEERTKAFASEVDRKIKIYGKLTKHFSEVDSLCTETAKEIIVDLWLKEEKMVPEVIPKREIVKTRLTELINIFPQRYMAFCPGCPHRAALYILKRILKKSNEEFVVTSDVGCCLLGAMPPICLGETVFCMGASISTACGLYQAKVKKKIIAIIGDSTFLHAGIQALINCCYTNVDIFVYILDNRTVAMTGLQSYPGIGINAKGEKVKSVELKNVVKACGVNYVKVVNPFDSNAVEKILIRVLGMKGQRVVIARHGCPPAIRNIRNQENKIIKKYRINLNKCTRCKRCISDLGCPAIFIEEDRVQINAFLCAGCGLCIRICPNKAIY